MVTSGCGWLHQRKMAVVHFYTFNVDSTINLCSVVTATDLSTLLLADPERLP